MRTIWSSLILVLAMVAVAGCTTSSPAVSPTTPVSSPTALAPTPGAPTATPTALAPPTASVTIKDLSFNPEVVTIARGGTVTWTNGDTTTHTIKFADGQSSGLQNGGTYSKTFNEAGTFDYSCGIHPSMHGSVKVV